MDPVWIKGRDIRVGDIICTRIGNRVREIMTVTSVRLDETQGHTYVHLTGEGQKAGSVLMADDRTWVLRHG